MDIFRTETDIFGNSVRVNQRAYVLESGEISVIDIGIIPPDGAIIAKYDDVYNSNKSKSQEQINSDARSYLLMTDWYVTRWIETKTPIPGDVSALRDSARRSVIP